MLSRDFEYVQGITKADEEFTSRANPLFVPKLVERRTDIATSINNM